MNKFTVLKEGNEVAEISIGNKEIEIVPKNVIRNISLVTSLPDVTGLLKSLKESGYKVTVKKGPLEVKFEG